MSQANVVYSCSSCGYPLNLSSSNQVTSGIRSDCQKSSKKGVISFVSVDLSRFTQVDEVSCLPITCGRYRSKTKLLCRKCGLLIGHGYSESALLCGFEPASSTSQKYSIKTRALQPSEQNYCIMASSSTTNLRIIVSSVNDFPLNTLRPSPDVLVLVTLLSGGAAKGFDLE
ncbi:hypothetical protein MUK42_35820 [Musa troglodytarum]|uniref:Uncharacterized protein n=1 Tax=Musa troglodytarum TaxID=320322 RepID=A0A9E7HSU2_9LILI|nr:hypothetical protein MUK42_35820 [Musa troglodytarum]